MALVPDSNYCAACGMPINPANDRPLFVIEGLTNLFNVVFFESLMEQELNRAIRYGHDLSVLVVEIDDLTALEAAYGYEETNKLIRSVGEAIAQAIRDPDTLAATNRVAALGTQRFLVLLPHTNEEGAFRAAEKIRTLLSSTVVELSDGPCVVTASFGVATVGPDRGVDANLVSRATQALIDSRAVGGNRIQVDTSI
ncbi:MAG: GGDEF domain-containing protein [Candidatus Dormibacteria bacterium]